MSGLHGPIKWNAGHVRSGSRRVRDEAIWSDTMSCCRHGRRLAVEASEEARSGPRFSTDGCEVWKWHERMVRRVFPARVWARLRCVTGEEFSWSDSQAQSLAARAAGNWALETWASRSRLKIRIVVVGVMLVAAIRLITARIMPTPGTEVAKASLADSSPVTRPGSPAGQGGDGRAVEADF